MYRCIRNVVYIYNIWVPLAKSLTAGAVDPVGTPSTFVLLFVNLVCRNNSVCVHILSDETILSLLQITCIVPLDYKYDRLVASNTRNLLKVKM